MIPVKVPTKEEKQVFDYLLFWSMYSVHAPHDKKAYTERKEECYTLFSKSFIDGIEKQVINSIPFNRFLRERFGLPGERY